MATWKHVRMTVEVAVESSDDEVARTVAAARLHTALRSQYPGPRLGRANWCWKGEARVSDTVTAPSEQSRNYVFDDCGNLVARVNLPVS